MSITLDNSNISVQYSTGSNYIIETVKSDLYRRNEIVDTIVRDNIQTAPVTPTTYVDSGNVYAVESYTYLSWSTANTTDYTRVFTKNTTCDILVVGGGGGGARRMGGGGGAGALIFYPNYTFASGSYNIKVGKGGNGSSVAGNINTDLSNINAKRGQNGSDSEIILQGNTLFRSKGGGGGLGGNTSYTNPSPQTALAGGSGGGNGGKDNAHGGLLATDNIVISNIVPVLYNTYNRDVSTPVYNSLFCYGNEGGIGGGDNPWYGSGGGGAGQRGRDVDTINTIATANDMIGVGGNGLCEVNINGTIYNFAKIFGNNINYIKGELSGGNIYYAGGGGGGSANFNDNTSPYYNSGGLGGGGRSGTSTVLPQNGIEGTGGGGGGDGLDVYMGGSGGSGIVIIRYLLGTIPAINYLTAEPIFLSPTITSNLSIFKHSGGTEAQTTHSITIGQNTICDILIVGGGGAGGGRQGAGGGAGGVMFLENQQLAPGNYTIKVGKGGIISGTAYDGSTNVIGDNGIDSEFSTFIAYGGSGGAGFSTTKADFNITTNRFASGGGATGWFNEGAQFEGWHNANERTNQPNVSIQGGAAYKGGRGWQDYVGQPSAFVSALVGGGGGGAGGLGEDATPNNNTNYTGKAGNGGVGLNYGAVFGTMVGDNGWFGGGGGGAGWSGSTDIAGTGGTGGGGGGNSGAPGIAGINGTGGGGGGGGFANQLGGIGGSGIVIVRIRTLNVITPVTEGLYKRLDFKFTPNYPEIAADKTTNIVAWYKFDETSVNEGYLDSNPSNIKHNLIKPSGSTPIFSSTINISGTSAGEQGTVSHLQFPTSLTDQLYTINNTNGITFSLWYNYSNNTPVWGSFFEFSQNSTDSGTNNRFGLTRLNLENKVELFMKSPTDVFNNFSFGTNTLDNNWHHLSLYYLLLK